ncbi:AAA family ATPase [Nesterenkonia pannonica]|uniref:AAA family ATPase n=1 Tax=Nesterenkonia pannonica TaxID=1548602 RepID=UPI002164EB5B|nr:AAA family ATPase [Nesterenkonia pannonica]
MAELSESRTADADQVEVLQLSGAEHGPVLVWGGPGTGKSTLAEELCVRFLAQGHDARRTVLLSPTRASAARMRERIEDRWAAETPDAALSDQPSRSFASYAFWLLGEARRRRILNFAARSPGCSRALSRTGSYGRSSPTCVRLRPSIGRDRSPTRPPPRASAKRSVS